MGLERFIRVNLILVPLLVVGTYLFWESLPILVLPLLVGYVTFTALLTGAWVLSHVSMSIRSS
ncbi:hypothetical protein RBH26_06655 [Natronolimnohabitans sp. A-GB9]|uniref:hypothetical protein n=1 Tax=Natronolimnohabitans sp. A-GB9 TaxID=3069757 RepID=UPI0027B107FA|nr:hypothetical protein [Natronolimnohabitans sp. A-GB9]MDQ2050162.1 hypothetical protein [Natronolimnohabitans sp. A-GB9]